MQNELNTIVSDAKSLISACKTAADIQELRVKYLGKKSQLTDLLKQLGQLDPADRPKAGQWINDAKQQLQAWLSDQENKLKNNELNARLSSEKIDVTLPGRGKSIGSLHPVTCVRERVIALFSQMGFSVAEGPEIEDEHHNFSALNFVDHHPAKESQDTFYFPDGKLLRTHTSPVQIRVMKKQKPPIRVITPGRVYRRDSDMTHTPMFHQLEGLVVDEHCNFSHLKGLLQNFLNQFFETEIPLRFRPGYFPFTEPSAEVDIAWGDRWLEVLGCGMVHPNVLNNVGIDSDKYSGFAFGIGLDRLAMLRYGINDLRMMFENDVRFLEQF
jgi:phenylalanyl-tRNA synthetase alpha chain